MNTESEAASVVANQVIHIVVEGFEMILRLSGKGVKELATMLYVAFKNHEGQDTPGKQKLAKILQTGTPRIFDLPKDETKNFAKEAKRYGISYCVLKPSKLEDKTKFEVIVHQEDAERVSRIMNRVHTATVEMVPEKEAKDIPITTEEDLLGSLFVDSQQGQMMQDGIEGNALLDDDDLLGSLFVDTQEGQIQPDGLKEKTSPAEDLLGSLFVPPQEDHSIAADAADGTPPADSSINEADRTEPDFLDDLSSGFVSNQENHTIAADITPPVGSNLNVPERTQPDPLDSLGWELFSEEGLENAAPQQSENPSPSRTQPNDRPSEHSSEKSNSSSEKKVSKRERSSVREELKEIKKELDAKKTPALENGREIPKVPMPKVSGKER